LKQEQGKNILAGGVSVPSQLIELGLVDEYRFVVGPIIAGEGETVVGRCQPAGEIAIKTC
jgi:dihydrofolate reductase